MLDRLSKNFRTFLWALALALAVWIAAVTAADPDEVCAYPTLIKVEVVGQDPGLVVNGSLPQEVQITLRAPQSVCEQLRTRPDGVRAILDLSGLDAGEHRLDTQVQVDVRPVRIVTVSPASVTLSLEPLVTHTFTLETSLSGQPAIGYQAGDVAIEPKEVVIAGPESVVSRVTRVRVPVNLSGIRESIDQSIPVQVLDENNSTITNVSVHPDAVHVSLPVIRQGGYRDMAVKVVVHGQVAGVYRLDSISVFPPVVTVYSSDPALINSLPGVLDTQPLELAGVNDNLNLRLGLNLPEGVSVVGQQTVLIQAGVSPIQSSLTLSGETVEVTGLPANLTAQVSPATVDVILSGPLPVLDTLNRQDVHVTVDVSGLEIGSHQLTPTVQIIASNVIVESLLPGTVEVIIASSSTPTPKP